MRCPKCNQEINPHSERCPNCGTSARYAVPDGDTMTRVRRQISVIRRENEVSDADLSDASFSPVLKFDRPGEKEQDDRIEHNPANNFPDESFLPVDLSGIIPEETDDDIRHRDLSASINRLMNNKEDDLLAEYYFKDGITDLEKYQLARSYERLEKRENNSASREASDPEAEEKTPDELTEEMSDAARRLSQFPEEKGVDRFLTSLWEKKDRAVIRIKSFFKRNVSDRCKKIYDTFDAKTSGFMNGFLDRFYYKRFGSLKRRRADDSTETYHLRSKVWGIFGIILILLICLLIGLNMMLSSDLNGKWIISTDSSGSPNIIMEFKPGGSAVLSVKSEDGWHVHKKGRYSTKRKNGHDLLTIEYEDGEVKRLYYIIDGKSGTFINVDTNVQMVYQIK